jgi:hypothetical protein
MNEMKLLWIGILSILAIFLMPMSYVQAADFNSVGDVGCKSAAISNLKNLANKPISFFGVGDYSYKCSSSTILPLWNAINSKKGIMGNHECEKGEDSLNAGTVFQNGGCGKGYFAYVRGGNTAVIGLNPYTSYKSGSAQYNFVVSKTNQYKADSAINWIVYIIHPLFYPVGCSLSHCHGVDNPGFNSVYEPIIKASGKGFILQAHTHLTAYGTPKGIPAAVCGGGGEDGTTLGSLNGYSWASSKMGFCKLHFELGKATAQLIGTSNILIHTHTWNKAN